MPSYCATCWIHPRTGSVLSAETMSSFASSPAVVIGTWTVLDGGGAFCGITCGSDGIVGNAGGASDNGNGNGSGNGGGGGIGGGGIGGGGGNGSGGGGGI